MYALRKLMQGSQEIPKAPLGNNARPLQPLHHRTVRTNIDFQNTDNALVTLFTTTLSHHLNEGAFTYNAGNRFSASTVVEMSPSSEDELCLSEIYFANRFSVFTERTIKAH